MKKYLTMGIMLGVILSLLIGTTGCKKEEKKITLASKPMTEQFILAEILTQLIQDKTDIIVEQKLGIGGGTSNIHPGLLSGEIDLYPEYTGTGWLFVLKKELIRDKDELYKAVKDDYLKEFNVLWSGMYGFNNTYGLAVKNEVAKAYNLKTYSDLAKVSDKLIFCSNADFFEREDGFEGLKNTYEYKFKDIKEIDIGLKYSAIAANEVDIITVFSTDGNLEEAGLTVLTDDKNYFPSYHCATLIKKETIDKYPEIEGVLEQLTGQIQDEDMIKMNYLVDVKKEDPKAVAKEFLTKKGLLNADY